MVTQSPNKLKQTTESARVNWDSRHIDILQCDYSLRDFLGIYENKISSSHILL